jgi:5'-3' exonuclease
MAKSWDEMPTDQRLEWLREQKADRKQIHALATFLDEMRTEVNELRQQIATLQAAPPDRAQQKNPAPR